LLVRILEAELVHRKYGPGEVPFLANFAEDFLLFLEPKMKKENFKKDLPDLVTVDILYFQNHNYAPLLF